MRKTLILSIGRTNSLPLYAKYIIENSNIQERDFIVSKQSDYTINSLGEIAINTYKNKKEFLLRTLFYLPFKFVSLIPKLYKEYDVLYLPYMHFWDLPFILFFKILKRKVVITAHDGILHDGENGKLLSFLNKFEIKSADELIVLTEFVKQLIIKKFQYKNKIHVIPHGLIENKFIKRKDQTGSKNLLFLGRISKYKGVELLIESVSEISESIDKLIIAGKSIYNINYGNHPKIEIQDNYLSDQEIGELLSWADVLILPYLEGSQSGVIALAINAELPMVCTNVGGFKEQLENDEAIWVSPNKESLKEGILSIINNVDLQNKIKFKLKQKKEVLSWAQITKQLFELVRSTK